MKKIILLLLVITLSYSCSSDSNSSSNSNGNNNGNSFTNSMDYEFTMIINGEVHKVKGNTTNGIPKGVVQSVGNLINNECEVLQSGGQKIVMLKINDVTATNYISGQNLECQILFPNLLLGSNQVQVLFYGSYITNLFDNLSPNNLNSWQTTSGLYNQSISNKLPINITDLGTIPTTNGTVISGFGNTFKGNYSGIINVTVVTNSGTYISNYPIQINIDFKAVRLG
jgi:hypothetical protein